MEKLYIVGIRESIFMFIIKISKVSLSNFITVYGIYLELKYNIMY